jgi:hypothetical protein
MNGDHSAKRNVLTLILMKYFPSSGITGSAFPANGEGNWTGLPLGETGYVIKNQLKEQAMQHISKILADLPSPNGSQKENDSQQSTESKHSLTDKANLAETLTVVCALQQQYGKTERELEILVEGFSRVLKHHPMPFIIQAIEKYTLNNSGIPAPADIEAIINPPPPKIDWPLYIELKKRLREGNVYVDQDEKRFIRNCEDLAILRQRGEMQAYNDAQKQLEAHKAKMLSYEGE